MNEDQEPVDVYAKKFKHFYPHWQWPPWWDWNWHSILLLSKIKIETN